ncbi:hypothetical protein Tco_1163727, partial [Tanacetum coccineum]
LPFRSATQGSQFLRHSLDTPHDSNANDVLTTTIATTVVAGTSVPQPREVNEPTRASIFADSTSACNIGPDVAGPSQPAGNDISSENFYVSLDMDSETLHQTYLCAMEYDQLFTEFNVGAARQTCLGAEVRIRLERVLRGKRRLRGKCGMQANLLKDRDTQIAGLKAQLSLKEAKAAEAIRLRSRIADIEAVDATRTGELESLKERNAALESAAVAKDFEITKPTQDLSSL